MQEKGFVPFTLYTERIAKNIKRIADSVMEPYGLRSSHVMCLLRLSESGVGMSSAALADACGVDKAFVSRITNELSEKGYIERERSPRMYKAKFSLTEKGVDICKIIGKAVSDSINEITKDIPSAKMKIFYEVLAELDGGISNVLKGK